MMNKCVWIQIFSIALKTREIGVHKGTGVSPRPPSNVFTQTPALWRPRFDSSTAFSELTVARYCTSLTRPKVPVPRVRSCMNVWVGN